MQAILYVYIYACTQVCGAYINGHIHTRTQCTHTHMYPTMIVNTFMHAYANAHMHIYIYIAHAHACMCACTHACMYTWRSIDHMQSRTNRGKQFWAFGVLKG